eukprot:PhM_4_TR656/c0_g1_i1/m.74499
MSSLRLFSRQLSHHISKHPHTHGRHIPFHKNKALMSLFVKNNNNNNININAMKKSQSVVDDVDGDDGDDGEVLVSVMESCGRICENARWMRRRRNDETVTASAANYLPHVHAFVRSFLEDIILKRTTPQNTWKCSKISSRFATAAVLCAPEVPAEVMQRLFLHLFDPVVIRSCYTQSDVYRALRAFCSCDPAVEVIGSDRGITLTHALYSVHKNNNNNSPFSDVSTARELCSFVSAAARLKRRNRRAGPTVLRQILSGSETLLTLDDVEQSVLTACQNNDEKDSTTTSLINAALRACYCVSPRHSIGVYINNNKNNNNNSTARVEQWIEMLLDACSKTNQQHLLDWENLAMAGVAIYRPVAAMETSGQLWTTALTSTNDSEDDLFATMKNNTYSPPSFRLAELAQSSLYSHSSSTSTISRGLHMLEQHGVVLVPPFDALIMEVLSNNQTLFSEPARVLTQLSFVLRRSVASKHVVTYELAERTVKTCGIKTMPHVTRALFHMGVLGKANRLQNLRLLVLEEDVAVGEEENEEGGDESEEGNGATAAAFLPLGLLPPLLNSITARVVECQDERQFHHLVAVVHSLCRIRWPVVAEALARWTKLQINAIKRSSSKKHLSQATLTQLMMCVARYCVKRNNKTSDDGDDDDGMYPTVADVAFLVEKQIQRLSSVSSASSFAEQFLARVYLLAVVRTFPRTRMVSKNNNWSVIPSHRRPSAGLSSLELAYFLLHDDDDDDDNKMGNEEEKEIVLLALSHVSFYTFSESIRFCTSLTTNYDLRLPNARNTHTACRTILMSSCLASNDVAVPLLLKCAVVIKKWCGHTEKEDKDDVAELKGCLEVVLRRLAVESQQCPLTFTQTIEASHVYTQEELGLVRCV